MKTLIIPMIALMIAATSLSAQARNQYESESIDSANTTPSTTIQNVLHSYYTLKDALVADNTTNATVAAKKFAEALAKVDAGKMSAEELRIFTPLKEKLLGDAKEIQGSSNLEEMREHFSSLSANMLTLVTSNKAAIGEVVYSDYCPMQKAIWLSNKQPIRNPYQGKAMLTCGNLKQTIK